MPLGINVNSLLTYNNTPTVINETAIVYTTANIVNDGCITTGINPLAESNAEVNFYPNPAQDYLLITTGKKINGIEIYNTAGGCR